MSGIDPNLSVSHSNPPHPTSKLQISSGWIKKVSHPIFGKLNALKDKVAEQSRKIFNSASKLNTKIAQSDFVNNIKAKLMNSEEKYIINLGKDNVTISESTSKKSLGEKLNDLINHLKTKFTKSNTTRETQPEFLKKPDPEKKPESIKHPEQPAPEAKRAHDISDDLKLRKNFVEGKGAEVVHYVKGKTQMTGVEQKVVYGPQLKNEETKLMENILNDMLVDSGNYQFVKDPNSEQWRILSEGKVLHKEVWKIKNEAGDEVTTVHYVKGAHDEKAAATIPENATLISSEAVDLGHLIKEVNFNHMNFTDEQLQAYADQHAIFEELENVEIKQNPKLADKSLSNAEKIAINVYSTFQFSSLQLVMQGNLEKIRGDIHQPDRSDKIKELLLTSAIAVQGLNKLPDYKSDTQAASPEFLFRYEKTARLPKEILEERIKAVKAGGEVTSVSGFLSTSHTSPAQGFENDILIVYENCKGKDIATISSHPDENEVLIPPTQVQWVGYHKLVNESGKEMHVFVARAVTTGSFEGVPTRPEDEEITENLPRQKK